MVQGHAFTSSSNIRKFTLCYIKRHTHLTCTHQHVGLIITQVPHFSVSAAAAQEVAFALVNTVVCIYFYQHDYSLLNDFVLLFLDNFVHNQCFCGTGRVITAPSDVIEKEVRTVTNRSTLVKHAVCSICRYGFAYE